MRVCITTPDGVSWYLPLARLTRRTNGTLVRRCNGEPAIRAYLSAKADVALGLTVSSDDGTIVDTHHIHGRDWFLHPHLMEADLRYASKCLADRIWG